MDFMVVVALNWQTRLIPVRPHSKLVQLSEKWVYDWNWLLLTCAFLYGLAENRKLHLTTIVHHAKRMRGRKHTLYCIIRSYHILCHRTANMHVSTGILISFPFLLPDDNEFGCQHSTTQWFLPISWCRQRKLVKPWVDVKKVKAETQKADSAVQTYRTHDIFIVGNLCAMKQF